MDKLDAKSKGESPMLGVRVTESLRRELQRRAKLAGVKPSVLARDILEAALGRPTSKARGRNP